MLGIEVSRVVRVGEVLVHIVGVLLKAALEPVTGPLQGVLDLLRSMFTKRVSQKEYTGFRDWDFTRRSGTILRVQ